VLITGFFAVRGAFGGRALRRSFDLPLFLMGTAFLLLETRGVTNLSLLFGSTWIVNTAVFSGVLILALIANLFVLARPPRSPLPWFVPLGLSVLFLHVFRVEALNELPLLERGLIGGLLTGLPIGLAGIIVSSLLARSADAAASLGSNLLGALLGGCLEYLSMATGLKALLILALILYAGAAWLVRRESGAVRTKIA
jgi:hypothetical protein